MTKKIFQGAVLLLAIFGLTGCSHEEDNLFEHSAAERLNEISGIYSQRLADSKGGWVMEYYPYTNNEDMVTGGGYLIMNLFKSDGSVYTLMKNDATWMDVYDENTKQWTRQRGVVWSDVSAWEVITDMGPVLTYNTYNKNLGLFSDPYDIPYTDDDEKGKGYRGDYEFVMVDVPENGDHIMLKGKKRGLYQRLSRVPEGTDFETYLDDIANFKNEHFVTDAAWELVMNDGGTRYMMNWMYRGYATIYPEGKDSVAYGFQEPYLITKYNDQYHLRFKDTIMVDGRQMEQEFAYSAEDDKFYGVIDQNNTIEGYPPYLFFGSRLEEMKDKKDMTMQWYLPYTNEMSAKLKSYLDILAEGFASREDSKDKQKPKRHYSFIGLSLDRKTRLVNGEKTPYDRWNVVYKQPSATGNTEVNYVFNLTYPETGKVAFEYQEPLNSAAQAIANTYPVVNDIMAMLNRTFVIEKAWTCFNLNYLKLVAEDDPDLWFILNFKNR